MTRRWMSEETLNALPAGYRVREMGQSGPNPRASAKRPQTSPHATPPALPPSAMPSTPEPTAMERMQAKGRLAKGDMNATEARYAVHLDQRKMAGEVLWWKFEAIKLVLAPNTSLTVDFAVMLACGTMEMHDVKGSKAIYTDDARAKMKIAANEFPFVFRVAYPIPKAQGGGWNIEAVRD